MGRLGSTMDTDEQRHTYKGENSIAVLPVAHCSRPNPSYQGGGCLNQCIDGFGIGATLGSVVGVLFGGIQAATAAPGQPRLRIFLKTVGTSALSFGVFLMAGSAIR